MQIQAFDEDVFHIIQINGDVDAASSIILDKAIEKAISEDKKNILIDCMHLNYISSAGLGVFVYYIEDFKTNDVFFALFSLSDKIKNIFEILGLNKLINIADSKEDAKHLRNDSSL